MSWNFNILLRGRKIIQYHEKESNQCFQPHWVADNAAPQLWTSTHRCQFYGSGDILMEEGDAVFGPGWTWHTFHSVERSLSLQFHGVSVAGVFVKDPVVTLAAILHRAKFRSLT